MSDKNIEQQNVVRRRGFLAGAATAGAAGAAVVATGVLSNKGAAVDVAKDENASKGYQVSEHVRRYYRTTTV
jgi:nitrous oxide reductase